MYRFKEGYNRQAYAVCQGELKAIIDKHTLYVKVS